MSKPYERRLQIKYRTVKGKDEIVSDGIEIEHLDEEKYNTIRNCLYNVFREIVKEDKELFGPDRKSSVTLDLKVITEK